MKASEALALIDREVNRKDIQSPMHAYLVLEEVRRILNLAKISEVPEQKANQSLNTKLK